jgi:tetratricopeptide (TPR) repeat protein
VVAAPFGVPVIRASLSTGLVEGLAMAIDWDWGTRTLHQYAAGMKRLGILPNIKELMLLTGFAAHSSSVSYVVAGSFCRFLIDRYGMRAMTNLYHTLDYRATYGRSLDMLMNEWLSFLDRVPSDDHDRDAVNALFRRPPIFQKVCARVTAERNVRAARMLSAMNFASAAALYKQSYDESHNYEALSGYLSSALREKNFDALTGILDSTIEKDPLPEQYLPLYVTIGIACWAKGDSARARDLFHQVELVDIQQNLTEAAAACRIALNDSLNRSSLLEYFLSSSGDTLRLGMLGAMVQNPVQHWLPLYLKGILLHRLGRFPEVLATLHALDPGVPEKHLEAIRLKTMGDALVRMRRFQEAKACFWVSLNAVSTDAAQHEINDLIDRCEWISEHGLE